MRLLLTWWLVLSCSLAACSSEGAKTRDGGGAGSKAAKKAPDQGARPSGAPTRVEFQTSDGVTIVGTLESGGTSRAPAVVLVHQLSSNRGEWAPVVERLRTAPGLTTLAIDMRGHGESTRGPGGATLAWQNFSNEDWAKITEDVRAAIDFIGRQEMLQPSKLAIVGSSIGSSAAIVVAGADPQVAAVVALSPGRAYHGIDALTPLQQLGQRPILVIASRNESFSAETAEAARRIAGRATVEIVEGDKHGVAILSERPAALERIVQFLRTELGATR